MREIKFRAWDKREKKMRRVKEMCFNSMVRFYETSTYRDFTDIILMQYTGLKDAKGKEIYEGDILDKMPLASRFGKHYKVVKKALAFGFEGLEPYANGRVEHSFDTITNEDITEVRDLKVIGNIYETPELLEAK